MGEEVMQVDLENGTQEVIKTGKCQIKFDETGKLILDCEGTDPAELSSFEINLVQKVSEVLPKAPVINDPIEPDFLDTKDGKEKTSFVKVK